MLEIHTYLLDDDADDLERVRPFIERVCGVNFSTHTDVNDLLNSIKDGCHIAIIDSLLSATGMNGVEVGKMVLSKNSLCTLMMYSGHLTLESALRATNAGFRYIVDKNAMDAPEQLANGLIKIMEGLRGRIEFYDKWKEELLIENTTL